MSSAVFTLYIEPGDSRQLVILGALGALDALIDVVPQFISPYTIPILEQALQPDLVGSDERDNVARRVCIGETHESMKGC